MQIRCNFPDISYLSETQKNNFQFLIEPLLVEYDNVTFAAIACIHLYEECLDIIWFKLNDSAIKEYHTFICMVHSAVPCTNINIHI